MRDKALKEQRKAFRRAYRKDYLRKRKRSGSVLAGLLLMCVGTLLLLRAFGVPFPEWLFTWPMIIIAFGLMAGAGNAFRDPGWAVICGVGTVFLLQKIWPNMSIYMFVWPVLIIVLGFIIILAPRRHRKWHERWEKFRELQEQNKHDWKNWEWQQSNQDWQNWQQGQHWQQGTNQETPDQAATNPENTGSEANRKSDNWLDSVAIFGNIKKLVYSKNFKGGDVVSIFGGAEINLMQADFNGEIVIEMVQIFSGAKLIVPPHWQIRSEMVAIFGGIEDKRPPQTSYDENKVVVLNGTTFFGGLEIKSY
jgi:predicted membrane protein